MRGHCWSSATLARVIERESPMGRPKASKRKRNKSRSEEPSEGGGLMMGMRSGFKKTAKAVTGKKEKKNTWLDFLLNILLILAVLFLLYRLFTR